MRFGIIVIGDEILSGKRRDRHIAFVVEALATRGHELAWAQIVGDDGDRLERVLRSSFAEAETDGLAVFCFGGIGATPDDRTRQSAAKAADVPLELHAEGVEILEKQFGETAYPHRIRMVDFPQGSELIPNPVNRVPGFSFGSHHFVPGFPNMAHPMIQWVLDTKYPPVHAAALELEQRRIIENTPESELIPIMESLLAKHHGLRISCLPSAVPGTREIDLGLRGMQPIINMAGIELEQWLTDQAVPYRHYSS